MHFLLILVLVLVLVSIRVLQDLSHTSKEDLEDFWMPLGVVAMMIVLLWLVPPLGFSMGVVLLGAGFFDHEDDPK